MYKQKAFSIAEFGIKIRRFPISVQLSVDLSPSERIHHQNRIAMDTSEFDRIAFLAGTVSLLPQDIDPTPCSTNTTSSESTPTRDNMNPPADLSPG
jgi:hypothetical protein